VEAGAQRVIDGETFCGPLSVLWGQDASLEIRRSSRRACFRDPVELSRKQPLQRLYLGHMIASRIVVFGCSRSPN
jgi:hypothetical protein